MEKHCKDCCCARSWKALGITKYTGKSIPEHILELQAENKRLKEALQAIIVHEEDRKKCGIGYDLFVHDTAVEAVVF